MGLLEYKRDSRPAIYRFDDEEVKKIVSLSFEKVEFKDEHNKILLVQAPKSNNRITRQEGSFLLFGNCTYGSMTQYRDCEKYGFRLKK